MSNKVKVHVPKNDSYVSALPNAQSFAKDGRGNFLFDGTILSEDAKEIHVSVPALKARNVFNAKAVGGQHASMQDPGVYMTRN